MSTPGQLVMEYDGLHRVISGGQTGADQGGLVAAWRAGLETGGQAPTLFKTQGGYSPILEVLGLVPGGDFKSRTIDNIRDSDATILLAYNMVSPGSVLAIKTATLLKKPLLRVDISNILAYVSNLKEDLYPYRSNIANAALVVCDFIVDNEIRVVNIAGNRELAGDGLAHNTSIIHKIVDAVMTRAFFLLKERNHLICK